MCYVRGRYHLADLGGRGWVGPAWVSREWGGPGLLIVGCEISPASRAGSSWALLRPIGIESG